MAIAFAHTLPLKVPAGKTEAEMVESIGIDAEGWRAAQDEYCITCNSIAYMHPYSDDVMACRKCRMIVTDRVHLRFYHRAYQGE